MTNQYNNYKMPNTSVMNYNNIVWVIGVEGARAYQIPPNSSVIMLDSENEGIMYIKTSDNIGMCNIRIFKFEELTDTPKKNDDYITRTEFEEALKALKGGLENEQPVSTAKPEYDAKRKSKAIITE